MAEVALKQVSHGSESLESQDLITARERTAKQRAASTQTGEDRDKETKARGAQTAHANECMQASRSICATGDATHRYRQV